MTQFLRINPESIRKAGATVQKGGLVIYPTDTVYGLGCDPFNEDAVDRLASVKGRYKGNLPVLVGTIEKARELGKIDGDAETLATRFWPGPLTIVVSSVVRLPFQVMGPNKMIGLRVPGREDTLDLISKSGGSLVGTSANISGTQSQRRAEDALRTFEGKVDVVLDGGPLSVNRESTVVRPIRMGVQILREGAINEEEVTAVLRAHRTHPN